MTDYESPLDKILREARERGEFDDLPGKGKPIQWEDEALVPEDQRLANRLLKHNNFTLDWIELGQELDHEYEKARKDLELARSECAAGRLDEAGWKVAAGAFVKDCRGPKPARYRVQFAHTVRALYPPPVPKGC